MKKLLYKISILIILLSLNSCLQENSRDIKQIVAGMPVKNLSSYSFNPRSSLIDRVGNTPSFVLDYLESMDKRDDYLNYQPTEQELKTLEEYLYKLPLLHQTTLKDRLVGIFFIENIVGSGLADYIIDKDNNIYAYLVFNPGVLKHDISSWLTYKENTCFIEDVQNTRVEIDCGNEFLGLLYILLHETTHIVDHIQMLTPYVEEEILILTDKKPAASEFIKGIWQDYSEFDKSINFAYADRISFYGMNDGPKINISEALAVYKQLEQTPFVSIYATLSWAEDLAEFFTFYHLTRKLNTDYCINIYQNDVLIFSYKPMENNQVIARFPFFN